MAEMLKIHQKLFALILVCVFFVIYSNSRWLRISFSNVFTQNSVIYRHRQYIMRSVCQQNNLTGNSSYQIHPFVARQLFVEHTHRFIYCEVPKVGCTNWKRIILLLNKTLGATLNDLEHNSVHTHPLLTKLSAYSPTEQAELLNNYTKVMFVRDPLQRLVSAYRDKFLHEDEEYYYDTVAKIIKRSIGRSENSTGKITFEEFARFVVQENPLYRDTHWKPMYELCDPCNIRYDIVGKFETMKRDSDFVLKTIKAPKNLAYPSIKHYANETRTSKEISMRFFSSLSYMVLEKLMAVYRVDFAMFDYIPLNNSIVRKHFWRI
ncbi:carbohydrate sulfotransferase 8-like [Spea bombifrons]|uniref:carbohydrate sulfotransferase 8-like n=1 Tax=Spea bombifrons TaxID=233779 RepID=UPI002349EDC3|nr:carbohydrate sulfotransferase 8-like [Spea bombifrons]